MKIEITEDAYTLLDEIMSNSDHKSYSDVIIGMHDFIMIVIERNDKLKGI